MRTKIVTRAGLEFFFDRATLDSVVAFARDIRSSQTSNSDAIVLFSGADETGHQLLGFGVLPISTTLQLDSFKCGLHQFFMALSEPVVQQLRGKCITKGNKGFEIV